jgi:hypothetical protein
MQYAPTVDEIDVDRDAEAGKRMRSKPSTMAALPGGPLGFSRGAEPSV